MENNINEKRRYYYGLYLSAKEKQDIYTKNLGILSSSLDPISSLIADISSTNKYSDNIKIGNKPVDNDTLTNMKGSLEGLKGIVSSLISESNRRISELEREKTTYLSLYSSASNQ